MLWYLQGEERTLKERKLELDDGNKSDHLIMAKVIKMWDEEEKRGKGRDFCDRNFLTRNTLFGLRDLKQQFTNYLLEMGFIDTSQYKSKKLNANSENVALIKAVICSGLYPNVAIIKYVNITTVTREDRYVVGWYSDAIIARMRRRKIDTKSRGIVLLRTHEDGNVSLHPKSVNTVQQNDFESTFLVYHEKLKSSCIFIYDTTMVSSLPLLFFCQNYLKATEGKRTTLRLNDALVFKCHKETGHLIEVSRSVKINQRPILQISSCHQYHSYVLPTYIIAQTLKIRLHSLLEYRLSHPSGCDKKEEIDLLRYG